MSAFLIIMSKNKCKLIEDIICFMNVPNQFSAIDLQNKNVLKSTDLEITNV